MISQLLVAVRDSAVKTSSQQKVEIDCNKKLLDDDGAHKTDVCRDHVVKIVTSATNASEPVTAAKAMKSKEKSVPKTPLVRGEAVVQRILEAALHELAQVGYQGFRMEDVASRAGVNKTTVYRRWPTKPELVRDALYTAAAQRAVIKDTGSIRADLFNLALQFSANATNPVGRSIFRMLAAEGADPELAGIIKTLRDRNQARAKIAIDNAIARGELPPGIDHVILIHALIGALHHRIFLMQEPIDDVYLTTLVDMLLYGATRAPSHLPVMSSALETRVNGCDIRS